MKRSTLYSSNDGFTLIETVVTIVIISILAVSILPKFSSTDGYDVYTYRDQIIASLRLNQLQAMQQTNNSCHQVLVENKRFGKPDLDPCGSNPAFNADWQNWQVQQNTKADIVNIAIEANHIVNLSLSGVSGSQAINFDSLGRPSCINGCEITITGAEVAKVCIESQGYIHAC
jgi:MSHA pilin protein MshC